MRIESLPRSAVLSPAVVLVFGIVTLIFSAPADAAGGLDTLHFDELTHLVEVDLASGVVIAQGRDSVASIHFVWGTDHANVIRAGSAPLDAHNLTA